MSNWALPLVGFDDLENDLVSVQRTKVHLQFVDAQWNEIGLETKEHGK